MRTILLLTGLWFSILSPLRSQEMVSYTFLDSYTSGELQALYGSMMEWDVKLYRLLYTTPDVFGVTDTASGLVVLPISGSHNFPTLVFQHGTVGSKSEVPSQLDGGWQSGQIFGGLGYIAVLPDLLGLGTSRGFHPYLHAATEASAAIDMIYASRELAAAEGIGVNETQNFITGYSQGGHSASALHRELEANYPDLPVRAATHMSGPYDVTGTLHGMITDQQEYLTPAYIPNIALSFQYVYGIYDNLEDFFRPQYVPMIQQYRDGAITLWELNDYLITQLTLDFGGVFPTKVMHDSIADLLLNDPTHPASVAVRDNDVYEWVPQAPTRLIYCQADDQVSYINSIVADSVMNENGAVDLSAFNANPNFNHTECVEPAFNLTILFFSQYQEIYLLDTENYQVAGFSFDLMPNPARDQLIFRPANPEQGFEQLEIWDALGTRHYQHGAFSGTLELNVAAWPVGLYQVLVHSATGIQAKKLVITR